MARLSRFVALGLSALALAPLAALANPQSITVISPFSPPADEPPGSAGPYWSAPYWSKPYWSTPYWGNQATTPGSTNLPPQLASPYPTDQAGQGPVGDSQWKTNGGAQTCIAPAYTCPAPTPSTQGPPCSCPAAQGQSVSGTVH